MKAILAGVEVELRYCSCVVRDESPEAVSRASRALADRLPREALERISDVLPEIDHPETPWAVYLLLKDYSA